PTFDWCKHDVVDARFLFCSPGEERSIVEAALQAGTIVFDQAQFDTCLALLQSMAAGGACVQPPRDVVATTCLRAFRGQIAPGEACPWPPKSAWVVRVMGCKDGSCDNGVCVPFLKPGDACPFPTPYSNTAKICDWVKGEWCHGDPDVGGAGGGDGGTQAMG